MVHASHVSLLYQLSIGPIAYSHTYLLRLGLEIAVGPLCLIIDIKINIISHTGVSAATPRNIDYILGNNINGQAVIIVIGGAREVYCQDQSSIELVLKNRKGFVKKALQHGADLVPTFSFGENLVFSNPISNPKGSYLRNLQEKTLDVIGWPFPFFMGRGVFQYSFGILPKRHPITVVGKLILLMQINVLI